MKDIIEFLQARPLISIRGLEKECSIPLGTIRIYKDNVPEKYKDVLLNALMPYGFHQVFFAETIKSEVLKIAHLIEDNPQLWDDRKR